MFTTPLPIARYRFTAQVQQHLPLPDYAGSLLRGQFGAALRNVACMTRAPTCPGCPLIQTCPYTRIFEAPPPPKGQHALQDFSQIPNPYIIEPPLPGARLLAAGELLQFNLVLVGHAIDQLALMIFALQRALKQGLTRQRIPAELQQVDWLPDAAQQTAHPVWRATQPTLQDHNAVLQLATQPPAPTPPNPENAPASWQGAPATRQSMTAGAMDCHAALAMTDTKTIASSAIPKRARGLNDVKSDAQISLHIHTPLRLQSQGKPLGVGQLSPRALVAAVARRAALLLEFHAGQSGWGDAAKAVTLLSSSLIDTQELHWFDWTRYSSRQQQEMTLGGVLGTWTLHGTPEVIAQIHPWLTLGQWLHVGKNASMGLGGYTA